MNGKHEITVEVPEVEKNEIDLSATEEKFSVETTENRKYKKEIDLKEPIDPDKVNANFRPGILTIEVEKREEEGNEGKRIDGK